MRSFVSGFLAWETSKEYEKGAQPGGVLREGNFQVGVCWGADWIGRSEGKGEGRSGLRNGRDERRMSA